jgi:hypothetical protein
MYPIDFSDERAGSRVEGGLLPPPALRLRFCHSIATRFRHGLAARTSPRGKWTPPLSRVRLEPCRCLPMDLSHPCRGFAASIATSVSRFCGCFAIDLSQFGHGFAARAGPGAGAEGRPELHRTPAELFEPLVHGRHRRRQTPGTQSAAPGARGVEPGAPECALRTR